MSQYVEWGALANIIVIGLVFGAGLPTLFALGVRVLESPHARREDGTRPAWRMAVALTCLGVVAVSVIGAVVFVAAGGH